MTAINTSWTWRRRPRAPADRATIAAAAARRNAIAAYAAVKIGPTNGIGPALSAVFGAAASATLAIFCGSVSRNDSLAVSRNASSNSTAARMTAVARRDSEVAADGV